MHSQSSQDNFKYQKYSQMTHIVLKKIDLHWALQNIILRCNLTQLEMYSSRASLPNINQRLRIENQNDSHFKNIFIFQQYSVIILIILQRKPMLNKYQCFYKLSKTSECSIYTAFNRQTANNVLIKRIKTNLTWKEILCHKHVLVISKIKIFPKINEIFKHKGYFYFVFQRPYGHSLSILNSVQKAGIATFTQLMTDLLESVWDLSLKVDNLFILPQWVYFHRNNLKLTHFQPFLQPQPGEQSHVITHPSSNDEINPQIPDEVEGVDYIPQQYKKNLIFNLGIMAFRLATGKKQETIQTKQQFQQYVRKIREICQIQVTRATDDTRIGSFINKMLSKNKYQVPTLQQVNNFFQSRNRQQKRVPLGKALTVQIELERINLTTVKKQKQPRKKVRQCMVRQNKLSPKQNQHAITKLGFKSQNQLNKIKQSKLLLPYLSLQNKPTLIVPQSVRNRNYSNINRHHPFLNTGKRNVAYREHIKSVDAFKNEEYI